MKTLTLAVAAGLTAMSLQVAQAQPASDTTPQVAVRYGDLDLSRAGDAKVLLHRLQSAALQACGASDFSLAPYRDAVQRSACYRQGLARAVDTVGLPALSSLYEAHLKLASN